MKFSKKVFEKATPAILKECSALLIKIVQTNIKRGLFKKAPWGSPLADETIKKRTQSKGKVLSFTTPLYETGEFVRGFIAKKISWNKVKVFSTGQSNKIIKAFSFYWSQDGKGRNVFRKDQSTTTSKNAEQQVVDLATKRYAAVFHKSVKKMVRHLQSQASRKR